MPTIATFSDKPKHTIKVICAQTGVLPVTLRAWERRYNLFKPQRTSGNYRLYSDRDIALLRWIKDGVERGESISRVVREFETLRRLGRWPEAGPTPPPAPTHEPATPPEIYAKQLYGALTALNEGQAADVLREAQGVFDVAVLCLNIIEPCLVEIGEAWYRGAIRIATEHFASQYLRGRLMNLYQAYPARHNAPRIVVGCAPSESHDIGCLILALLLRREGYRVEFLGANVHLGDLAHYARQERPALICLSANSEDSAHELRQMDTRLAGMRPRPKLIYGGQAFNLKPALRQTVPGEFLGKDAGTAVLQILERVPL